MAAALTNDTVLNYSASLPPGKRRILYVDTEQSKFHCKRVLSRILRLAGLTLDRQPDSLEFLCLRGYATKERLKRVEEAIYEIEGLGLVVIDGIRDLAYDINSPGESTDLITKLMKWTDERKIHIHTVLHLNKGDDNNKQPAKRRNKFAGKEDISRETVDNILTDQIDRLREISRTNDDAAGKVRESVGILYEKRIPIDTEKFEQLNRYFIGEMERKLRKVKQPSKGLQWYIAMWAITLISAFLAGYFIQEYRDWKVRANYWYRQYEEVKGK